MIIEYLKKIRVDLMEEKSKLEKEQNKIQIKITENMKFIERLQVEEELNFEVFSPRNVNEKLEISIERLTEEQKVFINSDENVKKQLSIVNNKLDELNSVLKIARKQEVNNSKLFGKSLDEDEYFKLKILETQETERQRVARDLHDSSVQSLTSLVHKTELCSKLIDMDPIRCKLELSSISKTVKEVIEEMRQMIFNLRPMSFDDIGFDVTVERYLLRVQEQGVINTSYAIEGNIYQIKPVVALTLLRVIKEACSNVIKHAEASMISVKLYYSIDGVKIVVKDNGKGFVFTEKKEIKDDYTGFGLSTMRERVCLLSGKLSIDSKVGNGTKITIEVPINNYKEEK